MTYTHFSNLAKEVKTPADGTLSRTLYSDDRVKVVVFAFSVGQELSEHTASMPAILQFLDGEATVTLGTDTIQAERGTWIHMSANLPHSIRAKTPVTMLLEMLKTQ